MREPFKTGQGDGQHGRPQESQMVTPSLPSPPKWAACFWELLQTQKKGAPWAPSKQDFPQARRTRCLEALGALGALGAPAPLPVSKITETRCGGVPTTKSTSSKAGSGVGFNLVGCGLICLKLGLGFLPGFRSGLC